MMAWRCLSSRIPLRRADDLGRGVVSAGDVPGLAVFRESARLLAAGRRLALTAIINVVGYVARKPEGAERA